MGDIADMMLDGTLCAGCGVYLGSDFDCPQYCSSCKKAEKKKTPKAPAGSQHQCRDCGKKFATSQARHMHWTMKHQRPEQKARKVG